MGRTVKGCSIKGCLYFLPWSALIIGGLLGSGAFLYLLNSANARDDVQDLLRNVDTESTVNDVLIGFDGFWIATLVIASVCLAAAVLVTLFRLYQKCIINYELNKSASYMHRMRCCQCLELLGVIAALLATAWFIMLLAFTSNWLANVSVLNHAADQAADKKGTCSKVKDCLDTSMLPFWDAQQCICDTNTLRTIQSHAKNAHDACKLALIGSILLSAGGLLATAYLAAAYAYTSKNKSMLKERHDVYMGNKADPGMAMTVDATGSAGGRRDMDTVAPTHTPYGGYTSTYNNSTYGVMAPPTATTMDASDDIEAAVQAEEGKSKKKLDKKKSRKDETEDEKEERRRRRKEKKESKKEAKRSKSRRDEDDEDDGVTMMQGQQADNAAGFGTGISYRTDRAPWEMDDGGAVV